MNFIDLQKKITAVNESPDLKFDYFELIKEIISMQAAYSSESSEYKQLKLDMSQLYQNIEDEIVYNKSNPTTAIKFGTSGWRGIIGKDLTQHTVKIVTLAIIQMYKQLDSSQALADDLGINTFAEAKAKGVVIGHDNRFGGELFASKATDVLTDAGFTVYFGGEATTGTLSAAVVRLKAAFSINLTPSHNPLEYAGFKFNASDGGPAATPITETITQYSNELIEGGGEQNITPNPSLVTPCDTLLFWNALVDANQKIHTISPSKIQAKLAKQTNFILAVDSVHGASRIHVKKLLSGLRDDQVVFLRDTADVTFGGIAPEPSTKNLEPITSFLQSRPETLKLGVILDPDGDRIRFTDGITEINMNYFGAMAYHFLHEKHHLKGMVAKSVATSNLANKLAHDFNEEIFEPRVGFKEFKPVVDTALVCFEESDGITITHHTPEKDGYIGLFLALSMVEETQLPLGDYYREIINQYGAFYPEKDSVTVSEKGDALLEKLAQLNTLTQGQTIKVGAVDKTIDETITIDGNKFVFEDQSWLLIRPSGTEPKVRFYVESRTEEGKDELFDTARKLLQEIGLL